MATLGSNTSGHLFDTTFTTGGVLYSAANGVITSTNAGTIGQVLTSNGAGIAPTYQTISSGTTCVFSAYLNSTVSDVTGDGTLYNIIFNSTLVNTGSNYDTGTGVFTAPVTGNYQFNCTVYLSGLLITHTEGIILMRGSVRELRSTVGNFGAAAVSYSDFATSGSCLIRMSAGETFFITAFVNNGTKVVDVIGSNGSPDLRSIFSGFLIL